MTVIAVKIDKKEITIGADSLLLRGDVCDSRCVKIFQTNGIILGTAGYYSDLILFYIFCKTHVPKTPTDDGLIDFMSEYYDWMKKKTDQKEFDDSIKIFIYKKKVFYINGFEVMVIKKYGAIGSGKKYALTALHLGNSVKESLKVASYFNPYCGAPFTIIKIKR